MSPIFRFFSGSVLNFDVTAAATKSEAEYTRFAMKSRLRNATLVGQVISTQVDDPSTVSGTLGNSGLTRRRSFIWIPPAPFDAGTKLEQSIAKCYMWITRDHPSCRTGERIGSAPVIPGGFKEAGRLSRKLSRRPSICESGERRWREA